jgi:hypothetical protein
VLPRATDVRVQAVRATLSRSERLDDNSADHVLSLVKRDFSPFHDRLADSAGWFALASAGRRVLLRIDDRVTDRRRSTPQGEHLAGRPGASHRGRYAIPLEALKP